MAGDEPTDVLVVLDEFRHRVRKDDSLSAKVRTYFAKDRIGSPHGFVKVVKVQEGVEAEGYSGQEVGCEERCYVRVKLLIGEQQCEIVRHIGRWFLVRKEVLALRRD